MTSSKYNMPSSTYQLKTNCGRLYLIIVNDESGRIVKILHHLGKSGTCAMANLSIICDLLTSLFQHTTFNQRQLIMNTIAGHRCIGSSAEGCCSELLIRQVMEIDKLIQDQEEENA